MTTHDRLTSRTPNGRSDRARSFWLVRLGLVLIAALTAPLVDGCRSQPVFVWASQLPAPDPNVEKLIRPGDRLQVVVATQETLSGEFDVRPTGEVVLPTAGRFTAAGKTADGFAIEVANRLRGMLADPRVTVLLVTRHTGSVSVIGEVRTPGRYPLSETEGVLDALARAGGLTDFASPSSIFVIRHAQPSPRVRFRYADLVAADKPSLRFALGDGDVVVVE